MSGDPLYTHISRDTMQKDKKCLLCGEIMEYHSNSFDGRQSVWMCKNRHTRTFKREL